MAVKNCPPRALKELATRNLAVVVRDRHHDVHRLDREHALEHLDVPEDGIPPHPLRESPRGRRRKTRARDLPNPPANRTSNATLP